MTTAGNEPTAGPDLNKAYEPKEVEERWYAFWEKEGVFHANEDPSDTRPTYVVPLPPPNVTGSLHMGHAMMATLEDVLVRFERMRGKNTLWQPGIDHAGIATQTVVERQLKREGKTRQDLGREAFVERVWKWKAESGGQIMRQMRVLGASQDWPRTKFTMDPDLSVAVTEAFVRLYEEGLIYRAKRLINWCPECMTALSDLEVENEEGQNGELFQFAYKVEGSDEELVVATTRPETMLGDTAVAVHPDDPRYKHLHGKMLVHPFVDRLVPIITDAILVDPKFGTGAVKVTPAHDFNDFATGKRHNLPEINILNLDGTMNAEAGPFAGLERKRARTAVKKALDEKGLARGAKPHILALPKCQRSGGVVEPMISTQWFCKMKNMADAAIEAVRDGRTKIIPEEWTKTYDHFLENIQDWCVSRQLWWGHQIPAWHGPNGEIKVSRTRPPECGEGWTQDPDVLDTWFSSALWPFSTLGWPNETNALKKFYPANDLETGYDIIFFWVARMMMFGLHFMGEVPFKRILMHGMVVDETGDKMSKVKGNVIDPLDLVYGAKPEAIAEHAAPGVPVQEALTKFKKSYPSIAADIEKGVGFPAYGTDAVRYTLATYPPSNKRIALAPKRIEGYRHFANKIWNASRLCLGYLEGLDASKVTGAPPAVKGFFNRWILAQLGKTIAIATTGLSNFRIDEAAVEAYRFFWNDFCDWYLEVTKPILRGEGGVVPNTPEAEETRLTMAHVLETSLRLLHPLMPYITEELWQRTPRPASRRSSLAFGPYPTASDAIDDDAAIRDMELFKAVVSAARTIRSEHEVEPKAEVPLALRTDSETARALLTDRLPTITFLTRGKDTVVEKVGGPREAGTMAGVVPSPHGPIEILVGLKGLVTKDKELTRIERELKRIEKDLAAIEKKMSSKGFLERAPKEVIDETNALKKQLEDARGRLEESKKLAAEL
ncbi:Valyl-tRNA synthetase [Labilithrix luteola]|uniref:Valine--tRNA ligase n=1 Tax=Labilithrix luteola TaxID=1391654 RepID=A0A0K1QF16_9BACT|nr:valine--tRNA ligase [Labilithrix luteola]AKV04242.1 Valyl-tRNA synthetase [Labilithrix luteola]